MANLWIRRHKPSRREVLAALEVYKPLGWIPPMQFRENSGCWALVKQKAGERGKDMPCPAAGSEWYVLDSKTSNVAKGPTAKVRLCPKHASNAEKHYQVTKAVELSGFGD